MSEFSVVERPTSRSSIGDALVDAIAETADNGKAVKIPLKVGENPINVQSNLRIKLRKLEPPLRLKYRYDKPNKAIILWAEPLDDARETEDFDVNEATEGATSR